MAPTGMPPRRAWDEAWFDAVRSRRTRLWRAVEAQHVVSTLRLVDDADQQALLEDMLEDSKPPLPPAAAAFHYLLFTPFRYVSPWPSRFRAPLRTGVWYGAEQVRTALAEVGYWRWRMIGDSEAFEGQALVSQFTVFEAQVAGRCVNLCGQPWRAAQALWEHPTDYNACQALAARCSEHRVGWIRYRSVRDPQAGICGAVLAPEWLSLAAVVPQQTWAARVTADAVMFSPEPTLGPGAERSPVQFDAGQWS